MNNGDDVDCNKRCLQWVKRSSLVDVVKNEDVEILMKSVGHEECVTGVD